MQRSSVIASSFVRLIDGGQVAFAGAGAGQQWPIVTGRDLRLPCLCQLEGATVLTVDRRAPAHSRFVVGGVIGVTILLALLVRFLFINQVSGDYRTFVSPWYDELKSGGFAALGGDFSNYNPPYLYLLAAVTYLPVPKIIAIKGISMVFDVLLAMFAALIVRERFPRPTLPLVTFAVVLFAPTVVVNSAAWGQCDSIYAAFCLGSLYFLITRKPWWACVFFALGLSFKLQAIFFLPVLLIVLVVNRQRARELLALLAVPAVFAVMLLPALLAGRDLTSLLAIYPDQISGGGTAVGAGGFGGGGGWYRWATRPGLRRRCGQPDPERADLLSMGDGERVHLLEVPRARRGCGDGRWSPACSPGCAAVRCPPAQIVVLATTLVLAVPFLLPQMHERYFFLADVLTIVMALYVRHFWPVAVVVSMCSLLSYAPFLWNTTPLALPFVAFAEFLAVIATLWVFVVVFRDPDPESRLFRRPAGARNPVDSAVQSPLHPSPIR